MAKDFIVRLIDDITGETITEGGHTVDFSIEGQAYRIDLSDDSYDQFRELLAPYTSAAQKISKKGKPVTRTRAKTGTKEIRSWAKRNGYEVSDRGRIPEEIMEAYKAA